MEELEIDGITFVSVCKSSELLNKKGKLVKFEEDDDMQVALFRIEGELFCVSNICPHRHAEEIYNGILTIEDNCKNVVTCPLHGWSYFLDTGFNTNPKQGIKRITTYQIKEIDGEIYIEKPKLEIPKWRQ